MDTGGRGYVVREQGAPHSQPLPATLAVEMGSCISGSLMRGGAGSWVLLAT